MVPNGTSLRCSGGLTLMESARTLGLDTLSRLGRAVGTPMFHAAALAALGDLVPRDMEWIVEYDRRGRPHTHRFDFMPGGDTETRRDRILLAYEGGFYRFDPFYRYWRAGGAAGVIGMHEVVPPADEGNPYLVDFLPLTGMVDDVAVMLPLDRDRCIALTLERATRFANAEMDALRAIYPLLARLHETPVRRAKPHYADDVEADAGAPVDFASAVRHFTSTGLTPRERDIVQLILCGFPTESIARHLGVGTGTIRNHRKRLYLKLDITTERELFTLFLAQITDVEPGQLV